MVTAPSAAVGLHQSAVGQSTPAAGARLVPTGSFLAWLPGIRQLSNLYEQCRTDGPPNSFESRALALLGIGFTIETRVIPSSGPLIVAANHPTGIADGLVLLEAIRRTRSDVRVLANHLLARIPEMGESCFFIDPFARASSSSRNISGIRAAHRWLRRGGAILIFPAGEVASLRASGTIVSESTPADSEWGATIGWLALTTRAQVVPAFIPGRNSDLFYAAGSVHSVLRTLMLGRELLRQQGTVFAIRVGSTITSDVIQREVTPENATRLVRRELDALSIGRPALKAQPVAAASGALGRLREIASLPPETKLLSSGAFDVYCTGSTHIPNVLDELGRLREVTFRAVGEGTGRARDLDRFDTSYQQLFVWDREQREVVGAYRIGATDEIMRSSSLQGLYTSTLFRYDERLIQSIGPALELGRSFVRPEYQRSHSALLLLWRGIGSLVARFPRYRVLFGAVSISDLYDQRSQAVLRQFLWQRHRSHLSGLVHGLNPPAAIAPSVSDSHTVTRIEEVHKLVHTIQGDQGVPVLLAQYLRLNATVLGFNVDRTFGNALDALMMVDLTRVPETRLRKYLGVDNAAAFLDYHASRDSTPQYAA